MSASASLDLATSLEQSGSLADAEAAYRRCIGEEPQNAVARFNFACFLRRRGRLEEALEEHQSALDLGIAKPEEVLSNMAVIQAELRRDAAAKLLLERALTVNPTYPPALFNLALQYEEQGDRARALELFRQILEIDPSWHDALVRIAHAETVRDPDGEIVRKLRRALRRSNLDPLTRESLHFALGKALDDCARYDEAFEQFALGNAASRPRLSRYDRVAVDAAVDRVIREFSSGAHGPGDAGLGGAARLHHRHVPLRLHALRAGARRASARDGGRGNRVLPALPVLVQPAGLAARRAGLRGLSRRAASRARNSSRTSGRMRSRSSAC